MIDLMLRAWRQYRCRRGKHAFEHEAVTASGLCIWRCRHCNSVYFTPDRKD